MSTTIDERVVEMRFDNRDFERNCSTSMSTLGKLKQSLNLSGASKGLENIGAAAKGVNMSGLTSAVDTVSARFSALQIAGVTALANITNSAVNTGKRMISALTIDPIKTGFQEYETQINAVQTILANTESKGTTITDVNKALDTLNTYADKTIYNFTEMTRNIGTFTAAGVDLDTSVSSIQGIANLAAVSGSTSQQASTAMYQLSQALAAGKVSLMDWNSVVNAGMGGQVFQDALKRTATVMGKDVDGMIKKYGSFRESLTKGEWLTTDVLTKTLEQFTMAAKEGSKEWDNYKKSLMDEGYTEKQATEILKMANTATDAATKVKTFTQLWDTLKEAAQSGWTQTWEILIGDFEEAKSTLTKISDVLNEMIGKSAEARNKVLQGWKDAGGRDDMLAGFAKAFESIMNIVKPIKEAFSNIFPPVTVDQLLSFTKGFKDLMASFAEFTSSRAGKIKSIFKGIFSIASLLAKVFGVVAKAVGALLTSDGFVALIDLILDALAALGDFFTSMNKGFETGGLSGGLSNIVRILSDLLESATGGLRNFGDALAGIGGTISKVGSWLWDKLVKGFEWITDNISAGDIFAGLVGGGIFVALKKLADLFGRVQDVIDGIFGKKEGLKEKLAGGKGMIADTFESLGDALDSFATGVQVGSIVAIAVAIGILAVSLNTISKLDVPDIAKSLIAIGGLFTMLSLSFKSITKSLSKFDSKGIVKSSFALILVAAAMNILADAMVKLSDLSLKEIAKGLIGVGGGLGILTFGLKKIGDTKISLKTSIAMLALAESCKILGDAMEKFADMSWDEIARGLAGMGGALGELVVAMGLLSKFGGGGSIAGSVGIFITVQSLGELADSLKKFADMTWEEIKRGLAGMGGALGEVAGITGLLGKLTGFSGILGSGAILIAVQSLGTLADSFKKFAGMTWEEIKLGLVGMGGALGEVATITGLLGKLTGLSGLLGAGALLLAVQGLGDLADAFKKFGQMTWEEIKLGLVGMGGALLEVAAITGTLGRLTGLSGLLGAGALLLAIQGLGDLADAFKKFGGMTWEEIKIGLVGMGGALGEVAIITGALGSIAGLPALLGSGAILIAVQGLGDIADALKKFGEMSWEEIERGLTAMGAALGEIALGGFLNTLSIIGSFSIAEMAEPLGVLADSVKKWKDVEVPEGLGWQLATLAAGINSFTLSGLGAMAIAELGTSLGDLATSVNKWQGVTVPEGIGEQLKTLADGVGAFTWGGLGASAIAELGAPLGDLATSVSKWANVTVPENMGEQLEKLAEGVKAFSFAFMGSWSIDALAEPLGELPAAIKKWQGVSIPEGLNSDLTELAGAVQSFTWAFAGGWSIDAIKGPLGDLAGTVKKWNGVTIPSNMGDKLKDLASGLKSFTGISDISKTTSNMKTIASSAKTLSGVDYESIAPGLKSLASGLKKLATVDVSKLSSLKSVSSYVNSAVDAIKKGKSKFSEAGTALMKSLAKGMKSGQSKVTSTIKSMIDTFAKAFTSKTSKFNNAGKDLMDALVKGIGNKKKAVKSAATTSITSAVDAIKKKYSSFYSAGEYLAKGLAAGISDNSYRAEAKAKAMAEKAVDAAKKALDINSPSKVFRAIGKSIPEGLAAGIDKFGGYVKVSTRSMASTAIGTFKASMTRLSDAVNNELDAQPTIRPVLDLSEISAGASSINGMFINPSLGVLSNVGAISTMMESRQNGNEDVVAAINRLNKALSNLPSGDSYNINGITYDDGSNIAGAVRDIARYARMERRV